MGTATGTGTITDNDSNPPPSFALSSGPTVSEGATATFTVTKTGATSASFSVDYATNSAGTATAGSDFTATSGTLTFAPAETSKTFTVATIDDAVQEATETIGSALSSPTGGSTITTGSTTASITDNDAPIIIANALYVVYPAHQGTYICFTVYSASSCLLPNNGYVAVVSNGTFDPGYSLSG